MLVSRLAWAIGTVWLAASLAFLLIHLAPGGPAIALGGDSGAPGYLEEVARLYGLDRPLPEIYLDWLARVATGDLGHSYRSGQSVMSLILERLPVTLALVAPAVVLSAIAGTALGLVRTRRTFAASMAALHAVPGYLVGQVLVMAFALGLGILPVQGLADRRGTEGGDLERLLDMARHLILPILALALHNLTFVALLTRTRVMGEMERPYIVTAAAKGVASRLVRRRHALPNAMLGLVSLFGSRLGGFVAGAVTIEVLFALPGLGRLAVTSAIARDHPVVIGLVLFTTAVVVLTNLIVDITLRRLDPRVGETA
jgi:peptide/nickel transport system permease protein